MFLNHLIVTINFIIELKTKNKHYNSDSEEKN